MSAGRCGGTVRCQQSLLTAILWMGTRCSACRPYVPHCNALPCLLAPACRLLYIHVEGNAADYGVWLEGPADRFPQDSVFRASWIGIHDGVTNKDARGVLLLLRRLWLLLRRLWLLLLLLRRRRL